MIVFQIVWVVHPTEQSNLLNHKS